MRLAERATVSNFGRLKPPYVGVTTDLVIHLNLPEKYQTPCEITFFATSTTELTYSTIFARSARRTGLIASDRTSTGTTILQLTQQLCSIGAQNAMNQHPLVLAASSRYLGNFASVLNDCCR